MQDDGRPPPKWTRIGYGLTAIWMFGILAATEANPRHPWFDYIFVVPLAGWIVAAVVARVWKRGR